METGSAAHDESVVASVNERTDARLVITGRAAEGTMGGAIFADDRGERCVITRFHGSVAEAQRTRSVIELGRRAGLPLPRHDHVVELDDVVFVVQQRLPGQPAHPVTPRWIDALVEVVERFEHVLASRPDVPTLPLCLTASGHPYPRHETLAGHGIRSRRVLALIRDVGRRRPGELTGDDLVHIDLDSSNILVDPDGEVTGIVDWNLGVFRGDRHLGLVKTRFELEWGLQTTRPDPHHVAAADRLDEILADLISPDDLRRYWAHRLLYQLHFAIRSFPEHVIDWHLSLAESRLG